MAFNTSNNQQDIVFGYFYTRIGDSSLASSLTGLALSIGSQYNLTQSDLLAGFQDPNSAIYSTLIALVNATRNPSSYIGMSKSQSGNPYILRQVVQ